MTTVCTACGTENRDKARYCRGCARPLVPLSSPAATAEAAADVAHPHQQTRRSRSRARHVARQRRNAIRWGLGAVVLVAGLVIWRLWPGGSTVEMATAAAPPQAPAQRAAPMPAPPAPASTPVTLITSTVAVTRTTTTAPPTSGPPVAANKGGVAPRARPVPAHAGAAPVSPAPPPAPARSEPASNAPAAAPAPAPAAAAPWARSVDESCADRSNFLTRDICRIQACGNPAMAGDPVCVRFREMEAANRRNGN